MRRESWNSGGRGREIRLLSFRGRERWGVGVYISTELKWRYFEDLLAVTGLVG